MVIHFESIPADIQTRIAQKTDFHGFVELQKSAKTGRDLGNATKGIMEIHTLKLTAKNAIILKDAEDFYNEFLPGFLSGDPPKKTLAWTYMKSFESCPRLFVHRILVEEHLSYKRWKRFTHDFEQGGLVGKQTIVSALNCEITVDRTVFNRFLEVCNATSIHCIMDATYLKMPMIQKMHSVSRCTIRDEDLLALRAVNIRMDSVSRNSDFRTTLNRFLKQWLSQERDIEKFEITHKLLPCHYFWSEDHRREILADVPRQLLWSSETHNRSFLRTFELTHIMHFMKHESYYSLYNEDKALFIQFKGNMIVFERVENPIHELLKVVEEYRNLDGFL